MEGVFITTAAGEALKEQLSLMDKLTNGLCEPPVASAHGSARIAVCRSQTACQMLVRTVFNNVQTSSPATRG